MQYFTYEELRDRTARLIAFLESEGIHVNPSSRLRQYLKQLQAATKADGLTVPKGLDLSVWHRCLIEVDDLDLIAHSLGRAPAVTGWKEAFRRALGGGARASDELKHSSARDVQFELTIASMLRRSGYLVELAEPDVVVTSESPQFGAAGKRPRSLTKLNKTVRDADKQIARTNLQGIIAIDLSALANPSDGHIKTADFRGAFRQIEDTANNFLRRNGDRVRSLVDTSHTFGLMAHLAIPIYVADIDEPRLGYGRRWAILNLCRLDDPRIDILRKLERRLSAAE